MERKPKNKKTKTDDTEPSQLMADLRSDAKHSNVVIKEPEPVNYKFIAVGLAVVGVLALSQYKPSKPPSPKLELRPEPTIFRKLG